MAISQGLGLHFLMMTWKRPIASIFCTFILHTLTRYSDCAQNNGEGKNTITCLYINKKY